MPKVKDTIGSKLYLSNCSNTTLANLTKLHRKMEHYEAGCPTPKVKVTIRSKSCLCNNSKTTEDFFYFLTNLHRKIEHYETVCPAQELIFYTKVKVKIRPEAKLCLKLYSHKRLKQI